ncbi:MAG: heme biosynthesis HemY N-terminal domain-containing protein [Thiotrichaceae bacterium]
MKWLLSLLLAVAAGIGFTLFSREDPGFIVISRGHWTLETSLSLFILGLGISILLVYLSLNFLAWLWHLPQNLRSRHIVRQQQKARKMLLEGMLALWREQWQIAEQQLLKSASYSPIPALHYLAAAYATLRLPATPETQVRMADYFDHARGETALSDETLFLLQAKVQQSVNPRAALKNTLTAHALAPHQPEILQLLLTLYQQLAEWKNVLELLPEVRKYNVLSDEQATNLEIHAHAELLRQMLQQQANTAVSYWSQLPKSLRLQPELLLVYTQYLVDEGDAGRAEVLLREALQHQWDDKLINTYGQLRTINPIEQIRQAETWLKTRFNDVNLLLALARLCIREKDWGKAEFYLKSALNQTPANQPVNPIIYQTLGEIAYQRGDASAACEYYRQTLNVR